MLELDILEKERTQMWELFTELMDLDFDFKFTAKEMAKETKHTKSELNKYLFRLYVHEALLLKGKTPSGASIYSLTPAFLGESL